MPSWLIYSSTPSRGLPLNGSWSFLSVLSRNRLTSRSSSWRNSLKMISKYLYQLFLLWAKKSRVNQSVCGEISEYGALMSKWYDTVYTGKDLLPQPTNHIPSSNKSNLKSHLKATSLTRRTSMSKPGRLQELIALNHGATRWSDFYDYHIQQLLLNSLNHSISIMSDYLYLSSPWNKKILEVHHVLLQIKKYYSWLS